MPDSAQLDEASVANLKAHTRIDLGDITPHNVKLLKKVNAVVFPVTYHDKFYKDVLEVWVNHSQNNQP